MKITIVSALGILALVASTLCAPSGATGSSIDNLISSRVYNFEGRKLKTVQVVGIESPTNKPSSIHITDMDVSLDYLYSHNKLKTVGISTDTHAVTPSVYLELNSHFSASVGFTYSRLDTSSGGFEILTGNQYSPFISVDEELLHLFHQIDTDRTALFFEGNFSYTHADVTQTVTKFGQDQTINQYSVTPSLIFIQSLMDWRDGKPSHISLTLSPSYNYNYTENDVSGVLHEISRTGLITILSRLDYGITKQFYLNVSATWLHDANQAPSTGFHDWAQFGAGITCKCMQSEKYFWLFKAGYAYQAFHPNFDSHTVSARAEFHF